MELLVALGIVTAVAAAVRSTWSPCGLSVLSQITPFGERARGHRFGATAAWYVVGSLLGGVSLGLVAAALAAGVAALDWSTAARLGLVAVLALLGAVVDAHLLGFGPPFIRRQLNEEWLPQYRSWVYGTGFGWQIGSGFSTYVMTAAVFLLVAVAALTANPVAAMSVCLLFALVRGLAVLLAARGATPDALVEFFRRFDALGQTTRNLVIAVQVGLAVVAAGAAWGPVGAIAVVVGAGVVALAVRVRPTAAASS
jgi:hypothetical protein